jgi:predicted AlkP superfamily phosphohydrolase/phosphomutase
MRITVQNQSIELALGEWSDWVVLEFRFNPLVKLVGMTRFKLTAMQPYFRVYQEPLNWHPKHLPATVDISSPRDYAAELAEQYGLRETIGWTIATNPLKDEQIDYDTFLEDLEYTLRNRERVIRGELAKNDWDVFVGVFLSTDRMQHMMYRFWDESHPNYDADLAAKYRDRIPWIYEQMDRIVGDVMREHVDENTHLMIISDHGFHSFRRGVNLNTWLVRNGFMALKGMGPDANYQNLEDFFDPEGRFFKNVDWSRTRAYCLGLGAVYVNLRGREAQGIVNPSEYDPLREAIAAALIASEDPAYPGQPVVRAVYKREDIFQGPQLPLAPDLFVGFESGWRVSWQTGAGGIPPEIFEDNLNNWSGDHCSVAPDLTHGILFSNRPIAAAEPHIMDIGATVLSSFGVDIPSDYEGKPLAVGAGGG